MFKPLALLLSASALVGAGHALAQDATIQPSVVGMASAIEVAQASVEGGVLEAELETEGGIQVYEIEIVRGSQIHEVSVNAQTGEIVSGTEQGIESFISGIFQEDELEVAQAARGILNDALVTLEEQDGVRIEELSLDEEDGRWFYEIELEDAMGGRDVLIDATTGAILAGDD